MLQLEIPAHVRLQIFDLIDWWDENTDVGSEYLEKKLEQVFTMLCELPNVGTDYSEREGVRKFPVQGTPYHVFFEVDEKNDVLLIVAVWSLTRGEKPPV